MEFFLQQDGGFATVMFLIALLVGLLYLVLPIFAWRVWYWTRQNSKHLQDISSKLELLIRDIAPDALPPAEVAEEKTETSESESTDESTGEESEFSMEDEGDFFAEEEFAGDLSDDDSMEFAMAGEFDDVSEELSASKISDYTDDADPDDLGSVPSEESPDEESENEGQDELVMDFDDEEDDAAPGLTTDDQSADIFDEVSSAEPADEEHEDDFLFSKKPVDPPAEIPVADDESSDFTVEHFESNEEKSYEFEDVDDSSDNTDSTSAPSEESWGEPSTDDIWGEEVAARKPTAPEEPADESADEFSFGQDDSDVGAAFDEPTEEKKEEENVGDVASSFMADLENKLNLDAFEEKPASPPEAPTAPEPPPAPEPEPQQPAESNATLFARCEGCGHKLAYKQALSGKRVRCPACRTAFSLP
ncbi:MAG: hypothetical protein C0623_07475 [Desulfuromonas sp.]|nr:MAG: hypothetical protein C0623_07475 [Desulfuromonas sp.]